MIFGWFYFGSIDFFSIVVCWFKYLVGLLVGRNIVY